MSHYNIFPQYLLINPNATALYFSNEADNKTISRWIQGIIVAYTRMPKSSSFAYIVLIHCYMQHYDIILVDAITHRCSIVKYDSDRAEATPNVV
jgi:hypothetical protein